MKTFIKYLLLGILGGFVVFCVSTTTLYYLKEYIPKPNKSITPYRHPCEYQLIVDDRGTYIFDMEQNRFVGFLPYSNSSLDSLIIKDNQ